MSDEHHRWAQHVEYRIEAESQMVEGVTKARVARGSGTLE